VNWTGKTAALGVALSATLVAGCANGGRASSRVVTSTGGASNPAALLSGVATKVSSAGSSRLALTMGVVVRGLPAGKGAPTGPITIAADGAFDYVAKRGQLTLDLSGLGSKSPLGTSLEMVIDGDTAYVKLPPALAAKAGKPWARVSAAGLGGLGRFDAGQIKDFGSPDFALKFLQGVAGADVKVVGADTLRGTATTHYAVAIDPSKLASPSGGSAGRAPDASAMLGQLGLTSIPADVWVDGQGRLRKFSTVLDLGKMLASIAQAVGGLGDAAHGTTRKPDLSNLVFKMTISLEVYDYGTPVTVTVPPSGEVADSATVPGLGGGSGAGPSAAATA